MINWIHFNIEAPTKVLKQFMFQMSPDMKEDHLPEVNNEDERTVICVESNDVNRVIDNVQAVSERTESPIHVRYCASLPGSYHEIYGIFRNGELEIISDATDCILE